MYLHFSDAAKFAEVAKNLVSGGGYGTKFSFFGPKVFENLALSLFPGRGVLPAMPLSIAAFFKLFGIGDFAVIATSFFFYALLVLFTFLLGKKMFGKLVGMLVALAVTANPNIINYATSGASDILLMLEIVAAAYFLTLKRKWTTALGFLLLVLSYFTRPHAFIFIAGLILYWLLLNFKPQKAYMYFLGVLGAGILVDRLVLVPLSGKYFSYSITERGIHATVQHTPDIAVSDVLRGVGPQGITSFSVLKKVSYNLYNFYKLLPQIASPYMWALFVVGIFKWGKDKIENSLKIATIFMVVAAFLVTALTIPFFRYLHPIIPLVYLFATATLVWIVEKIVKELRIKVLRAWSLRISKEKLVVIISGFLIFFFVVGQTLGIIFLDSRFEAVRTNRGKPPVYVKLSYILRDNTEPEDIVITNLDTWGSWYGERKTIWFPLRPEQLKPQGSKKISFDAIYLTSYLIDDENYYMGDEWREIFLDPENIKDEFIESNYELTGIYTIPAEETYEKQTARAVLLTRKKN